MSSASSANFLLTECKNRNFPLQVLRVNDTGRFNLSATVSGANASITASVVLVRPLLRQFSFQLPLPLSFSALQLSLRREVALQEVRIAHYNHSEAANATAAFVPIGAAVFFVARFSSPLPRSLSLSFRPSASANHSVGPRDAALVTWTLLEGCTVELTLRHSYRSEGVHWPVLEAHADWLSAPVTSPPTLCVRSVHRLTSLRLALPSTVLSTNERVLVTSHAAPSTQFPLHYRWELAGDVIGQLASLPLVLPQPGSHQLRCTVSNAISSATATLSLLSVAPVGNLSLERWPEGTLRTHQVYTLRVCAASGSGVTFRWRFHSEQHFQRVENASQPACDLVQHVIRRVGVHNEVTVEASNAVSNAKVSLSAPIVVEEAISDWRLERRPLVVASANESATFRVDVRVGSNVTSRLRWSDVSGVATPQCERANATDFLCRFPQPGLFSFVLTLSNAVSNVSEEGSVLRVAGGAETEVAVRVWAGLRPQETCAGAVSPAGSECDREGKILRR